MAYKTDIKGLNEVIKRISSYNKELGTKVDGELSRGVINIATHAKALAPKGKTSELSNSISYGGGNYSYFVSVTAPYAPFVEFGTGSRVFKTPEFNFTPAIRAYARQFFVSGLGRLYPSPFLFPAYEIEKLNIVKRIRSILLKDVKV